MIRFLCEMYNYPTRALSLRCHRICEFMNSMKRIRSHLSQSEKFDKFKNSIRYLLIEYFVNFVIVCIDCQATL